jgi:quercetin dioxygenase-like cupin family protein
VTFLEMTLEAGQADVPHRHAGPVFGYVLEGEFEWAEERVTPARP